MKFEYLTENISQTKKLGELLAQEILKEKNPKNIWVLGLKGELGGGKTTFLQGFAKGIGIKDKILSPTFVIMKKFKIKHPGFGDFYHFDCYRSLGSKDIMDMGFKKIVNNPGNIIVIEWADKIKNILPKSTIWIDFYFIDDKKRKIVIKFRNGKI